jgi:hypothetical protein
MAQRLESKFRIPVWGMNVNLSFSYVRRHPLVIESCCLHLLINVATSFACEVGEVGAKWNTF